MFSPILVKNAASDHLLVIIKFTVVDWEVKRGQNFLTCGNDDRIDQYSADLATCQADAEAAGATHIFWQSADWRSGGDWCHLYASCDENNLRKPSNNGWTYYLDADKGWTIKSFRTCSTDYRVVNENNVNLANCKAKAEALGAAHIYWQAAWQRPLQSKTFCHVYTKCNGNDLRTPAENGINMQLL